MYHDEIQECRSVLTHTHMLHVFMYFNTKHATCIQKSCYKKEKHEIQTQGISVRTKRLLSGGSLEMGNTYVLRFRNIAVSPWTEINLRILHRTSLQNFHLRYRNRVLFLMLPNPFYCQKHTVCNLVAVCHWTLKGISLSQAIRLWPELSCVCGWACVHVFVLNVRMAALNKL